MHIFYSPCFFGSTLNYLCVYIENTFHPEAAEESARQDVRDASARPLVQGVRDAQVARDQREEHEPRVSCQDDWRAARQEVLLLRVQGVEWLLDQGVPGIILTGRTNIYLAMKEDLILY